MEWLRDVSRHWFAILAAYLIVLELLSGRADAVGLTWARGIFVLSALVASSMMRDAERAARAPESPAPDAPGR